MSETKIISMYAYVDGKFESQVEFSNAFPRYIDNYAANRGLNLKGQLVKLVADDEMSRQHKTFTDFLPVNQHTLIKSDAIFDRAGTMIKTMGGVEDLAISSGTQVFNYPISLDEGKWRDYVIASDLGYNIPLTWLLPQAEFTKVIGNSANDGSGQLQFDLKNIVDSIGGFPCFFKKAHGGGKVDVYKINDMGELLTFYLRSYGKLMILQQYVPYVQFIRTFVLGDKALHCDYNMDLPDGTKYTWPRGLSEKDRIYLDKATIQLSKALQTPFCTMESAQDEHGNWYFIDITNGCNFDMRPCELSVVYEHVASTLIESLVEWTLTPRPIEILGQRRQAVILNRQIARAQLKEQNPELLMRFAQENNISISSEAAQKEQQYFFQRYEQGRL